MSPTSPAHRWRVRAGAAVVSVTALLAGLQYAAAATAAPTSTDPAVTAPAAYTSPTVVNNSDGTLSLYAVRGDDNLWEEHQSVPFGTFSGWRQLTTTGGFSGMPAVVQMPGGVTDIFAVQGAGCAMWQTSLAAPGAQPAAWTQIGGTPIIPCPRTDPAAVVQASGAISLFSTDENGTILEDSQATPGGAFGSWQPIATITSGGTGNRLAVVQLPSGVIAIYVRAGGVALSGPGSEPAVVWGTSQSVPGGPFSAPIDLGGPPDGMSGDPVAIRTPGGVIAIYSSTTSGKLVGISQSKAFGPFGQWQQLSPQLTTYALHFYGTPAVLLTSTGVIAVYARDDTTSAIWGISQTKAYGPFSPWVQITPSSSVPSTLGPAPPFAMFTSTHVIAIYAPDSNNQIAGVSQNVPYGPFGPWQELG
jgi:hypothetical protein